MSDQTSHSVLCKATLSLQQLEVANDEKLLFACTRQSVAVLRALAGDANFRPQLITAISPLLKLQCYFMLKLLS